MRLNGFSLAEDELRYIYTVLFLATLCAFGNGSKSRTCLRIVTKIDDDGNDYDEDTDKIRKH